ncbi:MAG: hemerythrin domain-containing protein [Candidatus Eremiobacteraeota bacterium]|nr:hemerythrin domain-containing protein [Candidatus Eremiobacteraeota bacterium]MBV8645440.1 hemerythrin domain-containing protein [Candidatus Eremiobacteraeota bacterium]
MDILGLIKRDHDEVKALFKEFEGLGPNAHVTRAKLAKKIMDSLVKHDEAEEQTLYDLLKERTEETDERVKLFEAYTEHEMASALIKSLHETDGESEEFLGKFSALQEAVEHHIKDEEGYVHKFAREVLEKDELEQLGPEFESAKKQIAVPN